MDTHSAVKMLTAAGADDPTPPPGETSCIRQPEGGTTDTAH